MDDRTDACLDPAVMAAYVDGQIAPPERAAIEAHLATCADCYETMSEVLHVREGAATMNENEDLRDELNETKALVFKAGYEMGCLLHERAALYAIIDWQQSQLDSLRPLVLARQLRESLHRLNTLLAQMHAFDQENPQP